MERARAARRQRRPCTGSQTNRAMFVSTLSPHQQAKEGCGRTEVARVHRANTCGHPQMPPNQRKESLCLIDHHGFVSGHHSFEDSQRSSESGQQSCSSSEERSNSDSPPFMGRTVKYKDHSNNGTIQRDSGTSSSIERDSGVSSSIEKDCGMSSHIEDSSATASGMDQMSLHKNPLKWTVNEVRSWLDMMAGLYSISNLDKTKFSMNGLGVALIPKNGFIKRLGQQHGSLLYQDYHRRLKPALPSMTT